MTGAFLLGTFREATLHASFHSMPLAEPGEPTQRWMPPDRLLAFALAILALSCPFGAIAAETEPAAQVPATAGGTESAPASDDPDDEIVSLVAYNVQADRIEDFGLRVGRAVMGEYPKTVAGLMVSRYVPIVTAVLPNTAAARAGLQPGDRILKSDGRSTSVGVMSAVQLTKWRRIEKAKWAEVAAGRTNVAWTFEVLSPGAKGARTVKLTVPTPPPHWGAAKWRSPEGRPPAVVREPGPLAERSRAVLEHGIWTMVEERLTELLGLDFRRGPKSDFTSGRQPAGYAWTLNGSRQGSHRMVVTQFRGRTDIFLEARGPGSFRIYLTSPSGALEKAWQNAQRGESSDVPLEEARLGFEHELAFWLQHVRPGTGRWPFEVRPGYDPDAIFAALVPKATGAPAENAPPLPESFLRLRAATEAERALFADAVGKLGADHDRWAYTETARSLEDKRVRVTRVDPAQPAGRRVTLLSIDGKKPRPAELQAWRDDGGDILQPLGELPALAGLVDLQDVRVHADEAAALVFELPVRGGGDFSPDKFQALFRVNKTHRAFEDFAVRQRESIRVAGVARIVDAGLSARFQALDPAHPPQPVHLKGGGAARILLVKIARDFEVTRTDFQRVEPGPEAKP